MTFTKLQQKKHRETFVEESRQKAWGAAGHADWISKGLDELLAHYTKLKTEDGELEAKIEELENAIDYHTVENRNKRKAMQERRNNLAQQMIFMLKNHEEGQKVMQNLYQTIESNLALATHAQGWEWKEAKTSDLANIVDNNVQDAEVGDIVGPTTYPSLEVVEAPGYRCGNTKKLPDGSPCPGCRACQ